ncbi:hypothetical protein SAMN05428988_1375 [Chitinophaga sp. YR573]|uniref:DUF6686 family protein n=1 Tax=Chitinophaga sp. YR573 TaxID=1881040 RepID=UPI0008CB7647|nr:DUF6686 family protein [Chitinophaga sp. YR573]SEW02583.1 hypothetical protein SAMN05428988_1375 [Chitinophaga sp. YR573]
MCAIRTLCIKNEAHISHCTHCQTMYIWHNNLMLNFTPEDFEEFRYILNRQEFHDCCLLFPDGEERVIVHAPCRDISFTFTRGQLEDLKAAMDESFLMKEVYELIK